MAGCRISNKTDLASLSKISKEKQTEKKHSHLNNHNPRNHKTDSDEWRVEGQLWTSNLHDSLCLVENKNSFPVLAFFPAPDWEE